MPLATDIALETVVVTISSGSNGAVRKRSGRLPANGSRAPIEHCARSHKVICVLILPRAAQVHATARIAVASWAGGLGTVHVTATPPVLPRHNCQLSGAKRPPGALQAKAIIRDFSSQGLLVHDITPIKCWFKRILGIAAANCLVVSGVGEISDEYIPRRGRLNAIELGLLLLHILQFPHRTIHLRYELASTWAICTNRARVAPTGCAYPLPAPIERVQAVRGRLAQKALLRVDRAVEEQVARVAVDELRHSVFHHKLRTSIGGLHFHSGYTSRCSQFDTSLVLHSGSHRFHKIGI
mmetsp:Transcript_18721/g.29014  ORF Transcript_18721/g.29014 Transcript_18721/m.29014 type:complete len:296 (-) Transcript_18721:2280-3167(-)